jgi:hypothetical protein
MLDFDWFGRFPPEIHAVGGCSCYWLYGDVAGELLRVLLMIHQVYYVLFGIGL